MTRPQPAEGQRTVLIVSTDEAFGRELCQRLVPLGIRVEILTAVPIGGLLGTDRTLVVLDLRCGPAGEPVPRPTSNVRRPLWLCLTRSENVAERVALLRAGADDAMSPPVDLDELCLRVVKLIERRLPMRSARLVVGELALDDEARAVTIAGRRLHLSPTEFAVLRLLLRNCGTVVSKRRILREVWGYDDGVGDGHVVELYVSYLRKKLGAGDLIHTVRGGGYVLRPPTPSAARKIEVVGAPVPANRGR